jgi:hypothetical protein
VEKAEVSRKARASEATPPSFPLLVPSRDIIIRMTKSRTMGWVGHEAPEVRKIGNIYKILFGIPDRKKLSGDLVIDEMAH